MLLRKYISILLCMYRRLIYSGQKIKIPSFMLSTENRDISSKHYLVWNGNSMGSIGCITKTKFSPPRGCKVFSRLDFSCTYALFIRFSSYLCSHTNYVYQSYSLFNHLQKIVKLTGLVLHFG